MKNLTHAAYECLLREFLWILPVKERMSEYFLLNKEDYQTGTTKKMLGAHELQRKEEPYINLTVTHKPPNLLMSRSQELIIKTPLLYLLTNDFYNAAHYFINHY